MCVVHGVSGKTCDKSGNIVLGAKKKPLKPPGSSQPQEQLRGLIKTALINDYFPCR